ncbi:MAG: succinylglutamate desuccinylase/aspartoacylase family protein [Nitrospira sp.]|nr:succinylglutamate desuccinylase/aspartoacylase family protein [Nitrospira sp.]
MSQATAGEWADPKAQDVGATVEEFLSRLGGPTWILLSGEDPSRTRAVTTLLHGNEPSGVRAIFQWLRSGTRPHVNLACFIGVVDAALAEPGFAYRHLPDCRDLNRCFRMPFEGREGRMAAGVLDRLRAMNPEALIDFHNTSGRSPAYGVSTRSGEPQKALTALVSDHLIVTDLRLGTLMEATEDDFPTVTAECGGAGDARSEQTAMTALRTYAMIESLWDAPHRYARVKTLHHPIRVSLEAGKRVAYGSASVPEADLTLRQDADEFNFGVLNQGETLGWVRDASPGVVVARDAKGCDRTRDMFAVVDGRLVVTQASRIMMMTTNPHIAASDCLFYCLPVSSSELSID